MGRPRGLCPGAPAGPGLPRSSLPGGRLLCPHGSGLSPRETPCPHPLQLPHPPSPRQVRAPHGPHCAGSSPGLARHQGPGACPRSPPAPALTLPRPCVVPLGPQSPLGGTPAGSAALVSAACTPPLCPPACPPLLGGREEVSPGASCCSGQRGSGSCIAGGPLWDHTPVLGVTSL